MERHRLDARPAGFNCTESRSIHAVNAVRARQAPKAATPGRVLPGSRVQTMRRVRTVLTCLLATATWMASAQNGPSANMLTVDSIMRGPKLVGTAPTSVRWSRDSSTVYFTWQKAQDARPSTYAVNRDGSGLR